MKNRILAVLISLIPLALQAQQPYLVKDINNYRTSSPKSSNPYGFFGVGSHVYFLAATNGAGGVWQLCSSDGTAGGTARISDINLGYGEDPRFAVVNGKLIFNGRDSAGVEPWISDGTTAGTHRLVDIKPFDSSFPGDRIVFHDRLFFSADDGVNGNELWVTDGTAAGTKLFKDLVPGKDSSTPSAFVLFNSAIYFAAGNALWRSDGTESGTVPVKSFDSLGTLTVAGSKLFFLARTTAAGSFSPWVSDGTADGTHLIADLGSGSPPIGPMTPFGDRVLFRAASDGITRKSQLWITDGSAAGTHQIHGTAFSSWHEDSIAVIEGNAYFGAWDSPSFWRLWKTDGTEAGTMTVSAAARRPTSLVAVGNNVYFIGDAPSTGRTLWMSDGTAAGTHTVRPDATPLVGSPLYVSGVPDRITDVGGAVYFAASGVNGVEPWKSDGTAGGTVMLGNLAADPVPGSFPQLLTAAGDWIYLQAWDGLTPLTSAIGQTSLWRSDGTAGGTLKLADHYADSYAAVGRSVLLTTTGGVLWMSDGTPEGTAVAKEFSARFPQAPGISFVWGGKIFVSSTDGSVSGDEWVTALAPGSPAVRLHSGVGHGFTEFAGRVFFFSDGLWSSDGTPGGTYLVTTSSAGAQTQTAVMGGHLYFTNGSSLWKSDGTAEGTVLVKQLSFPIERMVATGRKVFFAMNNQLWATDGTDAGTRALSPSLGAVAFANIIPLDERVVFFFGAYNLSVWVSDGTPEGTVALTDSDVLSGSVGVGGGKIYFTRYDTQHGLEPWVTDGTKNGTKLVADIEPGVTGSNPQRYVRAGDLVFFTATTSTTGEELWALPLSSDPGLSVNDITAAEGDSGTATAHFTVTLSPASTHPVTVDYATVDDSAVAGSDYDAASGTLTFAAGETSKTIDVHLRGDTTLENNESFFLSLRNASGAILGKSTGFALIEDDDQAADVALSLALSNGASLGVTAQATNNGPRTATGLQLQVTQTPYDRNSSSSSCQGACPVPEVQLRTGTKSTAYVDGSGLAQRYVTATLTARELDPQASNNSIAWTAARNIAMDALFLTPGSDAHVWFGWPFTVNVESSNPAVLSVPASVSVPPVPGTFIAHGVSVGRANIRVFNSSGTLGTLAVDVVVPGTVPLWDGGVSIDAGNTSIRFDQQLAIHISASGTAPFTGKRATGTVTVAAGGREIGRVTLDPATQEGLLWTYLPDLGATNINASYSGDANFAPSTLTGQGFALLGQATIAATIDDNGSTARLHVRLIGSPMAAPTGSLSVYEVSVPAATQIPLTSTTPGVAEADIILTNLPAGTHTFRVFYPGDGKHYQSSAQDFREVDARKHAVRH